ESLKEDLGPLSGTEVTSVASEGREALSSGMLSRSQKSQRAAILVHYFVSGERVRVLVVSTSGDAYRELDITAKELNQRVAAFRQKLLDPKSNPRPEASALYDSIIRPIAGELRAVGLNDRKCHERKGASPGTLLVSLDGSLRYIPIGALFDQDCQEWLIEKVSIAVYASGGGGDLGVAPKSRWTVGAFGVSKATTIDGVAFPALTSVPDELASIVRDPTRHTNGILPGTEFLDDQFTKEAFAHATEARYSVVHIATHLSFSPTEDTSFLVIGGGQKLSIAELRKSGALDFRGVDLVTVSACDSALDAGRRLDGREIESFAALAQERGAKAVMASLWSVADPSTAALMGKFYKLREEMHIPKVDALREVQREFIRGGAKEKELVGNDGATAASKSPASGADWSHPYYWAPFVVLGNWL
ncbi:MAG TPA: CHAT domain-containing protein, partial [Candidatus Sulfotelmatobacter sp.]|nr:CHAT domain-containing protein [Candidatus Sulfotelmatobacter sp.]